MPNKLTINIFKTNSLSTVTLPPFPPPPFITRRSRESGFIYLVAIFISLFTLVSDELFAQDTPTPRVLVIFDTSGSMLWETTGSRSCFGDGSVDFPHRNMCTEQNGSRLFHAKNALSQVVDQVEDVEFGLMRYGQLEPSAPDFGERMNQVGAQYEDEAGNILGINYDGSTAGCLPADLLVSPSFDSTPDVLSWMDGVEDYPDEKELRANGYTPLTQSLSSARAAVATMITQDPESECRSYSILLLTDGYQYCPGQDGAAQETRMLVRDELVREATFLRSMGISGYEYDVRTFVVGFGPGTSFATELDELARAGGTAVNQDGQFDIFNGNAYQAGEPNSLRDALLSAINNARPRERCDGIDNDCDGNIDEDFVSLGSACQVGVGACQNSGVTQCSLDGDSVQCSADPLPPQAELCDDLDNDCDARIDEGSMNQCGECGGDPREVCDGGDNDCDGVVDEGLLNACGECGPLPEDVCNFVDDDCDGRTDEGVTNDCGGCGETNLEVCNSNDDDCDSLIDEGLRCLRYDCDPTENDESLCDGIDNDCDREIDEGLYNACNQCGPPITEICNGLDEDCDGFTDEDLAEVGTPCGLDEGACMLGVMTCQNGLMRCTGGQAPLTEICDGLDNDCDGVIEEGAQNACGQCGPSMIEVCDNIDNDCDGEDDTRDLCGVGVTCLNGECASPCMANECLGEQVCVEGVCSTPCRNRDCPSGWVCQNGECGDPCAGVTCLNNTYCSLGRCIPSDCYGTGCPLGQSCQAGACQPDPCATANCGPEQGCFEGQCFDDCDLVTCPDGSMCQNGACLDDPCLRISCRHPQVCLNGECGPDPCFEVDCGTGFICEGSGCIEDPCNRTTCPPGDTCHRGVCSSPIPNRMGESAPMNPQTELMEGVPVATPEGCDCDQRGSQSGGPLWLLLWLPIGLLLRRARAMGRL